VSWTGHYPRARHFTDRPAVLDFLARTKHQALAGLGTSCPDHFLRTKVRPLVLDLPPAAKIEDATKRLRGLHAECATRTAPNTSGTRTQRRRRCAAPIRRSCSCQGWDVQLRRGQAGGTGGGGVLST